MSRRFAAPKNTYRHPVLSRHAQVFPPGGRNLTLPPDFPVRSNPRTSHGSSKRLKPSCHSTLLRTGKSTGKSALRPGGSVKDEPPSGFKRDGFLLFSGNAFTFGSVMPLPEPLRRL